jgi:flavin reductase (DIM6/NTAB) family NADH-FMN oxidoreductase RutF
VHVNEAAKQTVLRLFPYGLYAVTVRSGDEDHGITAAWVMQAAFAPPMVAVAVENDSKGLPMIRDARAFAVNVLGTDQRDLATRLGASSHRTPQKLGGALTKTGPALGLPVLTEALGWLECRLVATMPAGSHTLVLGEVLEAGVERTGAALTLAESGLKYSG